MQSPVTVQSTAKAADLAAGYKARSGSVPRTFWQRAWIPWTLVVVMLGAMGAALGPAVAYLLLLVVTPFASFAAVLALLAPKIMVRKIVRANPFLTETQRISFADDGVECVSPSLDTKRPWSALTSWIERPGMLVLNLSDALDGAFMVICQGDTDDATWAAARARLATHLGPAMG